MADGCCGRQQYRITQLSWLPLGQAFLAIADRHAILIGTDLICQSTACVPAVQDMAATLNAFSILQGAGEQPQASSQKKKKNRSKKKGGAGSNDQAAVQDPVPEQSAEEAVRSTPEPAEAVEDGFQLAGVILRDFRAFGTGHLPSGVP